jgi:hypothetical protein
MRCWSGLFPRFVRWDRFLSCGFFFGLSSALARLTKPQRVSDQQTKEQRRERRHKKEIKRGRICTKDRPHIVVIVRNGSKVRDEEDDFELQENEKSSTFKMFCRIRTIICRQNCLFLTVLAHIKAMRDRDLSTCSNIFYMQSAWKRARSKNTLRASKFN